MVGFFSSSVVSVHFSFFIFNFAICISCAVIQVDNYGWRDNFNGTWNGAMGLYQKKKVQMLYHATIMRVDRLEQVEFTAEVFVVE